MRRFALAHPVGVARLRRAAIVWSWVSLPVLLLALVAVPGFRAGARVYAWCLVILLQLVLLARTKTVPFRLVTTTFALGVAATPLAGLLGLLLANALGHQVPSQPASVIVAGPLEETFKLLPVLVVLLAVPKLAPRMSVADWWLLGGAAGLGMQATEDAWRRIVISQQELGLFGRLFQMIGGDPDAGLPVYGFGMLPGFQDNAGVAAYSGHYVFSAVVGATIGLALVARRRIGWWAWLAPIGAWLWVTLDHAVFNASVWPETGDELTSIPRPLLWLWQLGGSGWGLRWVALALLVVALVVDTRAAGRHGDRRVPLPAFGPAAAVASGGDRLAGSVVAALPADAAASVRQVARVAAAGVRWSAALVAEVVRDLVLTLDGARRRRGVAAVVVQRRARVVEHATDAPRPVPLWSLLAAGCGLSAFAMLALVATTGEPAAGGAYVAQFFEQLGEWWSGLSLAEQVLVTVGLAALLAFGGMGIWPAIGLATTATSVAAHGGLLADLLRDPAGTVRRIGRELTPADVALLLVELAVGRFVPAALGARLGRGARGRLARPRPSPPMTGAHVRSRLDELPLGRSPRGHVRVARSDDEVVALFDELSRGGQPMSSSYPGRQVRLDDGTVVGLRPAPPGNPAKGPTLDVRLPDGSPLKVHVDRMLP